ncbi:conserved hypothetical protein [Sulfurovum sp. enrichment culture clone C5]|uniref:Metal dependent phosphohydrolase n=1 Tax=Sulfurovum sp. enrichment culture clone C5 TaxID=497650 RepID=A0A0S4XN71_9BACT|nr:conserved hypothetical protein [Sulfurovum sp. enrichment culture clone C5]
MREQSSFIITSSLKKFYFDDDIHDNIIDIRDIAHALSNICRFGGHIERFYSVAEHSVLVSKLVPKEHALAGLLHDATEAYMGDVVSPLKYLLDDYKYYENKLSTAIEKKFSVDLKNPIIKKADLTALYIEAASLYTENTVIEHFGLEDYKSDKRLEEIHPMPPIAGYQLFLKRFEELTK